MIIYVTLEQVIPSIDHRFVATHTLAIPQTVQQGNAMLIITPIPQCNNAMKPCTSHVRWHKMVSDSVRWLQSTMTPCTAQHKRQLSRIFHLP